MNVDRNIKVVPDLILSILLLSKADIVLKRVFAKRHIFFNFVTLKIWVALHCALHLANHKTQRSDFDVVSKANNGT